MPASEKGKKGKGRGKGKKETKATETVAEAAVTTSHLQKLPLARELKDPP